MDEQSDSSQPSSSMDSSLSSASQWQNELRRLIQQQENIAPEPRQKLNMPQLDSIRSKADPSDWEAGIRRVCIPRDEVDYAEEYIDEDTDGATESSDALSDVSDEDENDENWQLRSNQATDVREAARLAALLKAARQAEEMARAEAVRKSREDSARKRSERRVNNTGGNLWFQSSPAAAAQDKRDRAVFVRKLTKRRLPIPSSECEFHAARFYSDQLGKAVYDVEQWQEYLQLVDGNATCTGGDKSPLRRLFRFNSR